MSFNEFDDQGNKRVKCEVCGHYFHQLSVHLASKHSMGVADYNVQHPGAPTISEFASKAVSEAQKGTKRNRAGNGALEPVNQPIFEAEVEAVVGKAAEGGVGFDPTQPLRIGPVDLWIRNDVAAEDTHMVPDHDEHYQLNLDMAKLLAVGIAGNDNILVHGPAGCGKSSMFLEMAAILNQPVVRVNLNNDMRAADFTGEKVLDVDANGNSVVIWKDGVLPKAMRKGAWLVLDELDAAQPHILFVLQAVLERGGKLVLTGNGGEVVKPHDNFRIMATANTIGRGDDTGLYTGTNILNEAFLDRFGMVIKATYMEAEVEAKVVVDKSGIDPQTAERMVKVASQIRLGFETEQCYCTCSTRRLIEWAKKARVLQNARLAAKVTMLDRLSKDDCAFVDGIIQRIIG